MEFEKDRYSINEASEILNINTSTLRSWEKDFHLKIPRNNRNHRYYTDKEIEILRIIKDGREKNHSIETIKMTFDKHNIIEDQNEHATQLMKIENLTVKELQEAMFKNFKEVVSEVVVEREEELKKDFEKKLIEREEAMVGKIREQLKAENQKLMDHIAITRDTDKGFWNKIFKKK